MTVQETVTLVYPIPFEKEDPSSPAVAHGISDSCPSRSAWGRGVKLVSLRP